MQTDKQACKTKTANTAKQTDKQTENFLDKTYKSCRLQKRDFKTNNNNRKTLI